MTWDDFTAIYQPLLDLLDETTRLLKRAAGSWESAAATYQELTEYLKSQQWRQT